MGSHSVFWSAKKTEWIPMVNHMTVLTVWVDTGMKHASIAQMDILIVANAMAEGTLIPMVG